VKTGQQAQRSALRIGIASETTTIGSLGHYVACLDEAMKSCASTHQAIVTPKLFPPATQSIQAATPAQPGKLRAWLREIAPLRDGVRWVRRRIHPQWPQAREWARKWRKMPQHVIVLLPHLIISDGGELDCYYSAIADRRFVWVIHDLHGYHFPDQWHDVHLSLMNRRHKFLSERAAGFIVHNEFTRADAADKLSISPERISVVRIAPIFSPDSYLGTKQADADVLARLGIRQPYALWASSSTLSHKNHECLLEAWRIFLDRGYKLQLVCTGMRLPRWEQVSARIADLRLESFVHFTDSIPNEDMAAVLRNAHLAVCPTLFEGGGSGPASEAILASIPLAVSDIPQVRQQLFGLREGLVHYFDPSRPDDIAAAVEAILRDYNDSKCRAEQARLDYSTMQTWEMTARGYWNAIERAARVKV
jgi:glycosyltransferase involved in cell wall biosynthesis